ncbi:MOSC domain-containing protein [Metabacillus sp. RGM 3146]|uniref:MOSC domain-containing protein n=1 Tax=Metabacillus sp. RGM 3146 TaxID=3401092 RepID=UPI003B9A530B
MQIEYISKGKPKKLTYKSIQYISGIHKEQAPEITVSFTGISGDDVANHEYHGGEDRVVCVYPYEHYAHWQKQFGVSLMNAAFGENLTLSGGTEDKVCIGDLYEVGDTLLEVSQGRYPCATINQHTHQDDLLKQIFETGYTGYFFRVIKPGKIHTSSPIKLIERKNQLSVAFIHNTFFHDRKNKEAILQILKIPELAAPWKIQFEKLAAY